MLWSAQHAEQLCTALLVLTAVAHNQTVVVNPQLQSDNNTPLSGITRARTRRQLDLVELIQMKKSQLGTTEL